MGQAYEQALADGKGGKITPTKLRPYLEAQHIRETTGATDLFQTNTDDPNAPPRYVRGDKMAVLNKQAKSVAMSKFPGVPPQVATKQLYDFAVTKWGELSERDKKVYIDGAAEGESGFYNFMDDQLFKSLTQ